jgi:dipeptidyl aminopeptidase/acylaminoacyl peptidase
MQLTRFEGADNDPAWASPAAWSPDGSRIAYLQGGPPKYRDYDPPQIAVLPAAGGEPRLLTAALDRAVSGPRWSSDGRAGLFLLEDDRSVILARVRAEGGMAERLTPEGGVAMAFDLGPEGQTVLLHSTALTPAEVMALDPTGFRPLSRQNEALLQSFSLGAVEGIEWKSGDGTEIHGLLFKPPGFQSARRYPTIVYIHGGPVAQDQFDFDDIRLFLAAEGYLVLAPNYRGSSGRGRDFSRAIYADWGRLEVQDVLAGVDALVTRGLADPERLGIGGWSYGGMMTNYTIASDARFKAAASGASIANQITGYGTDQYVRQYEGEFGPPWKGIDLYLRTSYPFFHADRIKTPTLFLCGERDFNVPLINSEQMYQALRSLNVPTRLVIYPGQHHGLTKPSYRQDKLERYLSWFGVYLNPETKPASQPR